MARNKTKPGRNQLKFANQPLKYSKAWIHAYILHFQFKMLI